MQLKDITSLLTKAKTGLLKNTSIPISLGEIFEDRVYPDLVEEKGNIICCKYSGFL